MSKRPTRDLQDITKFPKGRERGGVIVSFCGDIRTMYPRLTSTSSAYYKRGFLWGFCHSPATTYATVVGVDWWEKRGIKLRPRKGKT